MVIVGVGVLTRYVLLHSMCDLKATRMKMQCSLIQELMLYEFELCDKTAKAAKNIYCAKDEGVIDH